VRHLLEVRGIEVDVIGFPGAGQAGSSVETIQQYAQQVASHCRRRFGGRRLLLSGHSFGATIAIGAAKILDDHCSGLVLVNGSLITVERAVNDPAASGTNLKFAALFFTFLSILSLPGGDGVLRLARSLGLLHPILRVTGLIGSQSLNKESLAVVASIAGSPAAGWLVLKSRGYQIEREAETVRCPVAILDGMNDVLIPPGDHRELVCRFKGPVLDELLAHTGHLIPLESPQAIVDSIVRLRRLHTRPSGSAKESS